MAPLPPCLLQPQSHDDSLSLFPSSSALSFFFFWSVVVCCVDEFPPSCCCCHRTIVRERWQTISSDPRGHRQAHPCLGAPLLACAESLYQQQVADEGGDGDVAVVYPMLCYAMYVGSVSYRKIVSVEGDGERESE
jgi:hypothetical protein